jgi:hypothetical protein
MDIYELAGFAYGQFEQRERSNGDTFTCLKDGAPEWLTELIRDAHGEFLPDDWRYDCIRAALGWIHDVEPEDVEDSHEFADSYVDIYSVARLAWLASDLRRVTYVDNAVEEWGANGGDAGDTVDRIGLGQYLEASEVYSSVVSSLQARLDEEEAR